MAKKAKLEIHKVLVVSTAHVPKALTLKGSSYYGFLEPEKSYMDEISTSGGNEYGWLVSTIRGIQPTFTGPMTPVKRRAKKAATHLQKVLMFARRRGCTYVLFDCDGFEVSSLKTFDW